MSLSKFMLDGKEYHVDNDNNIRDQHYDDLSPKERNKFKKIDIAKETAIQFVIEHYKLSSVEDIGLAYEAVEYIGLDDYRILRRSTLSQLKRALWESRIAEYICTSRAIRFGQQSYDNFVSLMKQKFTDEQQEIQTKIVTHVLLHGNDGNDDQGLMASIHGDGKSVVYNSNPTQKDFEDLMKKLNERI